MKPPRRRVLDGYCQRSYGQCEVFLDCGHWESAYPRRHTGEVVARLPDSVGCRKCAAGKPRDEAAVAGWRARCKAAAKAADER